MTPITAKLARHDISPPREDVSREDVSGDGSESGAPSSLPVVAIVSVSLHALIAFALVSLPLPNCVAPALDMTWVEFDLQSPPESGPPAAAPEITAPPEPELVPPTPAPEIVHRERPQPVAAVEPEIAPEIAPEPALAPPSIDDVFGEPPPPAAVMTGEGTQSAFTMAPGELGGVPGGIPGGHGTSLVSTVRPAPQATGPTEADRRRARRGYVHAIEELVRTHTRYPRAAARDGLQGRVELALRIGADGHVLAIRVASSSGSPLLDDAATDAARQIDRVPAPPALAALTSADEVRVGVVYLVR